MAANKEKRREVRYLIFLAACGGQVDAPIPSEASSMVPTPDAVAQDVAPDILHLPDAQPMICPSNGAWCDPGSPINFTCADTTTYWRCSGISPNTAWKQLPCDAYPSKACDNGYCVAAKVCP